MTIKHTHSTREVDATIHERISFNFCTQRMTVEFHKTKPHFLKSGVMELTAASGNYH
jgi:hypothetical protein